MKSRAWTLFVLLCLFFVGASVCIYTIIRGNITQVAVGQDSYTVTVASLRGTIYDRNMKPLLNVDNEYRAAVTPDETLLPSLRSVMSAGEYRKLRNIMTERKPAVVTLTKPAAFVAGVKQFLVPTRYGDRLLAPHLIGYLDNSGQTGVTGLEHVYNDLLQYHVGRVQVSFTVDGTGRCLQGVEPSVRNSLEKAKGGLLLTLDQDIQCLVEDLAPQYLEKGAVVVMDPTDGAVLAMASFPSFQPATVADSLENDDGALLNRALSRFDCGSVFKIITAAAALESGVSRELVLTCEGSMKIGSTLFHCHNRLGHQTLTMDSAMANSCNLYFIQLAQQIGATAVYQMAQRFGIDTPIDLAGTIGAAACVIPTLPELQQSPAALANFSFGQGKLLVSPLHVARMTATIANDGIMPTPYLIKGIVDEKGTITMEEEGRGVPIITESNAHSIQQMLEKVVAEGTGQSAAPTTGTAAGKTGTAETGQILDGKPVVQSWFTGYISTEASGYVITILAENAQNTGTQATALFCEISNNLIGE